MIRRILTLFLFVAATALVCTSSAKAQLTVNSDGVSVNNGAPNVVTFMFPTETGSNIIMIRFGCSESPLHEIFIYEVQPDHSIITYPFTVPPGLPCNQSFPNHGLNFVGSLQGDTTFTTADHTVTIKEATAWAAFNSGPRGWHATSGSSQIVVQ